MSFIAILLFSILTQVQPSYRELLLFGKSQADFQIQLNLLTQDSVGMAERDLIVTIIEDEALKKNYQVQANQFTVILIGKDGGEKFRSTKPLQLKDIFKIIDSMPMRQAEMKSQKNQ
jgi:hypothetical protein